MLKGGFKKFGGKWGFQFIFKRVHIFFKNFQNFKIFSYGKSATNSYAHVLEFRFCTFLHGLAHIYMSIFLHEIILKILIRIARLYIFTFRELRPLQKSWIIPVLFCFWGILSKLQNIVLTLTQDMDRGNFGFCLISSNSEILIVYLFFWTKSLLYFKIYPNIFTK